MSEKMNDDGLSEEIGKSRLGRWLREMSIPEIRSLVENDIYFSDRSPVIIEGLLRECETMNVIAAPKTGKTWLMMQLAVSIALGKPWLGRAVTQKKILVIDNELHPGELNWRYQEVCKAMNVSLAETEGQLFLWPQRGKLKSLEEIGTRMKELQNLEVEVVLLDAFYRAIPAGVDENSNTEIMQLYNQIDHYAKELNSAFILVHHTTKGSQKEKSVTDIGAGAGSQSRAADTHLILLPTDEKNVVEVKGVPRSFEPVEDFKIRRHFPLWQLEEPQTASAGAQPKPAQADMTLLYLQNLGGTARQCALIEEMTKDGRYSKSTAKRRITAQIAARRILSTKENGAVELTLKSQSLLGEPH